MSERLTLTIPEVADRLGISKNSAYELARQDQLPVPVIRLGRRIVVARDPFLKALGIEPEGLSCG